MMKFTEMPISAYVQQRLASAQFVNPTPVQAAAIPQALESKDVLATAATGTGKTLAFTVPIIENLLRDQERAVNALVLVPTRELAMQVAETYEKLRGKQLPKAAVVVGGLAEKPQLMAIKGGARLIVATPGRLEDYIGRKLVNLSKVRMLVLDEADRMLDMGFVQAIRRIVAALPRSRQTMCFSATLESSVESLIRGCMRNEVRVAIGSTLKPVEQVRIQAIEVDSMRKREAVCQILSNESGRTLIFARTKRGTERLAKSLKVEGFAAAMIHGDRTQSQRTAALAGFQDGKYRVLVATDVAARGIHVQDVAHVINYDLPQIAEDFVHRVGRTARAGREGIASTLFGREQSHELRMLEKTLGIKMERKQLEGDEYVDRGLPARKKEFRPGSTKNGESRIGTLPGEILQKHSPEFQRQQGL